MNNCNRKPAARAVIIGSEKYPKLRGEVLFCQQRDGVLVTARISGLPRSEAGFFGFHIHEGCSCGDDFMKAGGHYDPEGRPHPSHAGDLPPLLSCSGSAFMTVRSDRFRVGEIIGRTVIIHADADDFHTQPSGNSGEKIACGVIRSV